MWRVYNGAKNIYLNKVTIIFTAFIIIIMLNLPGGLVSNCSFQHSVNHLSGNEVIIIPILKANFKTRSQKSRQKERNVDLQIYYYLLSSIQDTE